MFPECFTCSSHCDTMEMSEKVDIAKGTLFSVDVGGSGKAYLPETIWFPKRNCPGGKC